MKRRPVQESGERYADYLKYKWELCRRNEDYKKDYVLFSAGEITPETMMSKWGYYSDPDLGPDEIRPRILILSIEEGALTQNEPSFWRDLFHWDSRRGDLFNILLVKDKQGEVKRILIDIDPSAPAAMILSTLEQQMSELKQHYDYPDWFPDKKTHWRDLEINLEIYDMADAEGKKHEEIAKILSDRWEEVRDTVDISFVKKRLYSIRACCKTTNMLLIFMTSSCYTASTYK